MRLTLTLLLLLGLSPFAPGQAIDPDRWPTLSTNTGPAVAVWKVTGPSGPSDYFNVDLGGLSTGFMAHAVLLDVVDTQRGGSAWKELAFRTSNAAGDPDVSASGLISGVTHARAPSRAQMGVADAWNVPPVTLGSDVHVTCTWYAGDSHLWLASDNDAVSAGRSAWTQDAYASPSNAFSPDFLMGAVGFPASVEGALLVNGAASNTVTQGASACLTFTACASGVPSALFLFAPVFFGPLAPISLTITGNPFTGRPQPNQWTICAQTDCTTPTGGPWQLGTIYLDPCDVKLNGKPRAKASVPCALSMSPARRCAGCFGFKDDGVFDGRGYSLGLPAGNRDFMNVRHGSPQSSSGVSFLTGVEIASVDLCGTGPSWASVGIYPDDPAMPFSPDLSAPYSLDPNPRMPPGAFDTGYPATFYAMPSVPAATTASYHTVVQWLPGETCILINADTSADRYTCATPLGGHSHTSGFSSRGYTRGSAYVNYANWMMQIKWN